MAGLWTRQAPPTNDQKAVSNPVQQLLSEISTSSQSNSTMDSTDEDDSDDEAEVKANRLRRLEQQKGWIGYLLSFKVFVPHIVPYDDPKMRFYMIVLASTLLLKRALNVLHPWFLGRAIDEIANGLAFPWWSLSLYVGTLAISSDYFGLPGLEDVLLGRVIAGSFQRLKIAAFNKIMTLSANFHDSKNSGEVLRAVEQAYSLTQLFHTLVTIILPAIIDLVISVCQHRVFFSTIFMSRYTASSRRTISARIRNENAILYEAVGNWATVSYFNRQSYEARRLTSMGRELADANTRFSDAALLMCIGQELSEKFGLISILLLAAYRISAGTSSVGDLITIERYWSIFIHPLFNLARNYPESTAYLVDAERLLELFETEVTIKDQQDAKPVVVTNGEVEFSHISFTYEGGILAIDDLGFKIKPNQKVALVGVSGSGKSTATKLLLRFYDIQKGKIIIDGQDVRSVTQASLREAIGIVPQDSVLFNISIIDNVRYGRLDATEDEIHAACRAAYIHDKIMSLPNGYQTRVGERAVKLSGGERQRIAIARCLLKNPKIVVLDEATSAMDSQTEAHIQEALKELLIGRTALIIAHRLSTIVEADVILVMDRGKIIERGTHDDLLRRKGQYWELWEKQAGLNPDEQEESSEDDDD